MSIFTKLHYFAIRIITSILILLSIYVIIFNIDNIEKVSEYAFIFINAAGLLAASFVPTILKKQKLVTTNLVLNIYLSFITLALLLGEIGGFFKTVPYWDSFLHLTSGGLITFLSLSIAHLLNEKKIGLKDMSPLFLVIFAFSFASMVGVMWEILEFAIDSIFNSNMQRYKDNFTGVPFAGQKALLDTMKDFMLNTLGALIASVIGYFDLSRETKLLEKVLITRKGNDEEI